MDYNCIPGTTRFIRPADPGTFSPIQNPGGPATRAGAGPLPLMAADIATQKLMHDEIKRQFNKCQAVEAALQKQIIEAIDGEYLQPLRNPTTDTIKDSVLDIFDFLKKLYGRLSPAQLKQKETILDNFIYDPAQNADTVFNKIQEFNDLCTLLGNGKNDTQLVTYAYLIFQKTGIFMDGLKSWNSKASNLKTFTSFKIHLRKEYSDLQEVGGLVINNTMPTQANIIQELNKHQVLMSNNVKEEWENNLVQTFKALNLIDKNNKNINYQLDKENNPQNEEQEKMMMNVKGKQRDPMIDQLLKQMTLMQSQQQALGGSNNRNGK